MFQMVAIEELAICITGRCNMCCPHCLRGDAVNRDIDISYVEQLLTNVREIGCLVLSGGEISLNVEGMNEILSIIKKNDIVLNGVYFVTNGKVVTDEFLHSVMDYFSYVANFSGVDDYGCGICVSNDVFHETIPAENIRKLQFFSAFNTDHTTKFGAAKNDVYLLDEGRAKNLVGFKKRELLEDGYTVGLSENEDGDILISDGVIYMDLDGDVGTCCDVSYNDKRFVVTHVCDSWVDSFIKKFGVDENR